ALGLFASTGSSQAQTSTQLRATIPFAFQAGSYHMPAGLYDISVRSNHMVFFEDRDPGKHVTAYLMATPSEDGKIQTNGRLIFHRYGDRYFLRAVWEAASNQGITCKPTQEEKEILRSQNQPAAPGTELAVNAYPKR
ncbi:MAG TPA: hypothetical protein VGM27_34930, partial [Acidobacteriaceae bacterium]